MQHAETCACPLCTDIRAHAAVMTQADRNMLASSWEEWISATDGESAKLRAGENGAPGSPRWTALQAIAATRLRYATRGTDG